MAYISVFYDKHKGIIVRKVLPIGMAGAVMFSATANAYPLVGKNHPLVNAADWPNVCCEVPHPHIETQSYPWPEMANVRHAGTVSMSGEIYMVSERYYKLISYPGAVSPNPSSTQWASPDK